MGTVNQKKFLKFKLIILPGIYNGNVINIKRFSHKNIAVSLMKSALHQPDDVQRRAILDSVVIYSETNYVFHC